MPIGPPGGHFILRVTAVECFTTLAIGPGDGAGGSVPVDFSITRLARLMDEGHDFEYALYPKLGHNNIPKTFDTVTDWIKTLSQ